MVGTNEMARNLLAQEPGRVDCQALAADTQIIAQRKPARHNSGTSYSLTTTNDVAFAILVSGRVHWTLDQLLEAGTTGCTTIHNPAPRWSAYIFDLRGIGVEVETITETHAGDFPGHHALYVLRSGVSLGRIGDAV